VRVDAPAGGITAATDECEAELVVMATHGRSGLSQLLLGSVPNETLRHGSTPLVLVRPEQSAGAAAPRATADDWVGLRVAAEDLPLVREALERFAAQESVEPAVQSRVARVLAQLPSGERRATE
jgi:hypothetical protein